ncbi:hypothetical protein D3C86_1719640 [compost metagenome]
MPRLRTVGKKIVFWSVVCWEAVKSGGERSMTRPFSTEQKAQWAAQVLTAHYPGRVYALLLRPTFSYAPRYFLCWITLKERWTAIFRWPPNGRKGQVRSTRVLPDATRRSSKCAGWNHMVP